MANIVSGLFSDRDRAGDAVAVLKEHGYTKDISILVKNDRTQVPHSEDIKKDPSEGATAGAAIGAVAGAIWAGLSSVALPGLGLLVGGPIAALLTGAGAGALTGGITGALVDYGIPENTAKTYEDRIRNGDVAVAVNVPEDRMEDVRHILEDHGAEEVETGRK